MTSRVSVYTAFVAAPLLAGLLAGAAAAGQPQVDQDVQSGATRRRHARGPEQRSIRDPCRQHSLPRGRGGRATRAGPGVAITLDSDVTFAFDEAVLKPEAESSLQVIGDQLRDHPATELMVIGHTDNIGDADYNQKLSEERAKAVAEFLVKAGVPAGELKQVMGMGDTQPVATNDTDEGRAKNRRVEIKTP